MVTYQIEEKMKKVFLLALLAAVTCFATIGCKKDDPKLESNTVVNNNPGPNVGTNPFAGNTYKADGEGRDENDYFAFQESKVSWGPDNEYNYTFDAETFTLSRGTIDVATVSYIFSEDKDTLSLSSSAGISGTYVKQ